MMAIKPILVTLLLAAAALVMMAAPAAANAIADGDFESGGLTGGWSAEANVTVATGDAFNGTYAVNVTSLAAGDPLSITYDGVNFSGATHNLSFALKITGASSTPSVRFSAAPYEGEWTELYSTTTKTDAWQVVEVDTDSFTGLYSIIWEIEPTGGNPSIVLIDSVTTDAGAYVASFVTNVSSGTEPLAVLFTDTSTTGLTAKNWSFTNVTPGNNTPVYFSTDTNPVHVFGAGNYGILLNASNATGYNITPSYKWVNVTAAAPGSNLIIIILNYIQQVLGYLPAHLLTGGYPS